MASPKYIQHNAYAEDRKTAFVHFFFDYFAKNPEVSIQIKRVIAEGD